jgi:hypothetical protein
LLGLFFAAILVPASAQDCARLPPVNYGPFDYRTQRDMAALVEKYHFTSNVEALISGATGRIGQDLEYTLDRIPNHHRALMSLMRLAKRDKQMQIPAMTHPVDCYFERALTFRRDDTVVRTMFAIRLSETGRRESAEQQLDTASQFAGDNAFSHFNIGLAYFDLGAYDKAVSSATRARDLGMPRTELIDRLRKAGKWPDAADAKPPTSGASAASAAGM